MKNRWIVALCTSLLASVMLLQSVAFAVPEPQANTDSERYLVSVETISAEDAKEKLPIDVFQALYGNTSNGDLAPQLIQEPTYEFDMHHQEPYAFSVTTTRDRVFSDYVFTGHYGAVKVHLNETQPIGSETYTFVLYKLGFAWDTVLYTYNFPHGNTQDIRLTCSANDKIYFMIDPRGTRTVLEADSYIAKAANKI